mmetsp:Transcript_82224/g.100881  ORF Transcript_82224/g.100881 Transcript_82224/m.100881 type:complete len:412 (+) Transcript_82224:123-1358(+)
MGNYLRTGTKDTIALETAQLRRQKVCQLKRDIPSDIECDIINEYIETPFGHILYVRRYIPKNNDKIKGIVFHAMGYGSFMDWTDYNNCMEFVRRNYMVIQHEHYGHGRSDGLWIYIKSFDILTKTANYVHNKCKELYIKTLHDNEYERHPTYHVPWKDLRYIDNEKRYILYGSSMGGALSIMLGYTYPNDYKGIILMSPMTGIDDSVAPPKFLWNFLIWLAGHFGKKRWVPQGSQNIDNVITSDKNAMDDHIENSALLWGNIQRLRTGLSLLRGVNSIHDNLSKVSIPFCVIHGNGDMVTSSKKSKEFYDGTINVNINDKELHLVDSNYHHLLWEPCRDYVLKCCFGFCDKLLQLNDKNDEIKINSGNIDKQHHMSIYNNALSPWGNDSNVSNNISTTDDETTNIGASNIE